jgi:beta-glucosidase
VQAILAAWLPGEEGGNAVAGVLFGKVNPDGKLPISFPRSVGQIPVFYGHRPTGGRSHWTGDYVNVSASPLYAFGHGLSYTSFAYDNLTIDNPTIPQDGMVTIACDVRNTGERSGAEVVQLYLHYVPENSVMTRPVKELKGFARIKLAAGEQKHVAFRLHAHQLAFYDEEMRYTINPGTVEVMLGSSSEDIRLTDSFSISGDSPQVVKRKIFFTEIAVGE